MSFSEVADSDGPKDGWRILGWCPNEKLSRQRYNELPKGDKWVAVMYEREDGERIWFHHIDSE